MLSLAHTIIGLPFAVYLNNPLLIFIGAFFSHFLADTLLHWNIYPPHFKRYPFLLVAGDILFGLLLAYLFLGNAFFTIPVWLAIAGGNAPDVMHGLWSMLSEKQKKDYFEWAIPFFTWHERLQLETTSPFLGLISQVIVIVYILVK